MIYQKSCLTLLVILSTINVIISYGKTDTIPCFPSQYEMDTFISVTSLVE